MVEIGVAVVAVALAIWACFRASYWKWSYQSERALTRIYERGRTR